MAWIDILKFQLFSFSVMMKCQSRNNARHCVHSSAWSTGQCLGQKWWNHSYWPIADATTSEHPETRPFVCNFSKRGTWRTLEEIKDETAKYISFSWRDGGGHFVVNKKIYVSLFFFPLTSLLIIMWAWRGHRGASHFVKDLKIKQVQGTREASLSVSPLHAMLWDIV